MKIKEYKCIDCKSDDFFFIPKDTQVGIYCKKCGKFFKWANKNEKNLMALSGQLSIEEKE